MALGRCWLYLMITATAMSAAIVDRIAIVVNDQVIKDSDIERDMRITDFLNGDQFDFSEATRKKAAERLIDQQLIRREVQVGGYPKATAEEVGDFLKSIVKQRFQDNDGEYRAALTSYGITEPRLLGQLTWQITVLHFIEQRFRPAVLVSDEDVDKYVLEHAIEDRDAARERLTEERVNGAFEEWLDGVHQKAEIEYHEAGLK